MAQRVVHSFLSRHGSSPWRVLHALLLVLVAGLLTPAVAQPVNTAPVAADDAYSVLQSTALSVESLGVLDNDSDADGDLVFASLVSPPSHGVLTLGYDGSFIYSPEPGFSGTDTFTYSAYDGAAFSEPATVTITVNAVNTPPVAMGNSYRVNKDTFNVIVPRPGILANDTDADGDSLTAKLIDPPANGTLTLFTNGAFIYVPNGGFQGTDTFTYQAYDGYQYSATATVSIEVNGAPVAADGADSTDEDTEYTGVLVAPDAEADSMDFQMVANGTLGTTVITDSATGAFTYTPNPNVFGVDTFTFKAIDAHGAISNTATFTITINSVNDAPTATPTSVTTDEDVPCVITLTGTDVEGDPLIYFPGILPEHGMLLPAPDGVFAYLPDPNYSGSDSFTFMVSDGFAMSAPATVEITITPINDAPTATATSFTTDEDVPYSGTLAGTDVDTGDTLTLALAAAPANGTVTLDAATGNFTYTPAENYNGSDSFTFTVSDGTETSAPATVDITVTPMNDVPSATATSFITDEDVPYSGTLAGTDSDVGDTLTFALTAAPVNGAFELDTATGAFTYTPDANYNGSDSFTFTVSDGTATSAAATVEITVTPMNDVPSATAASVTTDEDVPYSGTLAGTDVDTGDTLTFALAAAPVNGTITLDAASGAFTYTPAANYNGSDSFTFTVSDGTETSAPATVEITVTPVNDAPTATATSVTTDEDVPCVITLTGTDVEGDLLIYYPEMMAEHGMVLPAPNGVFTYFPNPNYYGSDSFTFTVADGSAMSAPATVEITVNPINDAPTATAASVTTDEDVPYSGTLAGTDVDTGDTLTFALAAAPVNGTITIDAASGAFTYTPAANYNGSDSFTFTVSDGTATSAPATVEITVTPMNDAPTATPTSVTTDEDVPCVITLTGTDVEGDPLTYLPGILPEHGMLLPAPDGVFTYVPNPNYYGSDSFTFIATDGSTPSVPATVDITVNPINDAPTVGIASPANGAFINEGEDFLIGLNTADIDGTVVKVIFKRDGAQIGVDTTAPFSLTLAETVLGAHSLMATAEDNNGATADSAVVSFTVLNVLPTAAITTPGNGSSFVNGDTVVVSANASDPGGIDNVVFYANGVMIGEDATAPYQVTWDGVATGTYELTARAYDSTGASALSGIVTITVCDAVTQPDVMIRKASDVAYIGENVQNDLAAETQPQDALTDLATVYYVKVKNAGNRSDRFTIVGTANGAGYTVAYTDAVGIAVDGITAGTYVTPLLNPGDSIEFQVRVTFDATIRGGEKRDVLFTATSQNDATKSDTVVASTTKAALNQVTLTTNPATTATMNSDVTISAEALGGGATQFKFRLGRLQDGVWTWSDLTGYALSNTTTWTPDAVGTYALVVYTREVGSTNPYDVYASKSFTVTANPVTAAFLTVDPAISQPINTTLTLTASVTGGPAEYKFRVGYTNGGSWIWETLREYSTSDTCTWQPTVARKYSVMVYARALGSTQVYQAYKTVSYTVTPQPITAVDLTTSVAAPRSAGTRITLSASTDGGGTVQYKFRVGYNNGGSWVWETIRDYATSATCTWQPTVARTYSVVVYAREAGSTVAYQAWKSISYVINPPISAVSLVTAPTSPQRINTPVTVVAVPTGGSYIEYRFRVGYKENGTWYWTTVQNYGPSNVCTWIPTVARNYTLVVDAREIGTTTLFQSIQGFTVNQ